MYVMMYIKEMRTMTTVNATNLRKNLFEYLSLAIDTGDVVNVTTRNGSAVIISEEDYRGIQETLSLLSIPGMKEKLIGGMNTKVEDCEDFSW
jgi:prevent-host-death family protein